MINKGNELKFTIWYVKDGQEIKFDKTKQNGFNNNYPSTRIEWEEV